MMRYSRLGLPIFAPVELSRSESRSGVVARFFSRLRRVSAAGEPSPVRGRLNGYPGARVYSIRGLRGGGFRPSVVEGIPPGTTWRRGALKGHEAPPILSGHRTFV